MSELVSSDETLVLEELDVMRLDSPSVALAIIVLRTIAVVEFV